MKIVVDPNDKRIGDIIKKEYSGVADIGLIGVPFDGSTRGRPGARFAPRCIREELYSLVPVIMGRDIGDSIIVDFGDVPTFFGSVDANKEAIYNFVREKAEKAKRFIVLGGDHSITHPSIKAFSEVHGKPGLIVFDAHLDLRELSKGAVSSGTVIDDIIKDLSKKFDPKNLVYLGIREFVNPKYYLDKAKRLGAKIYFSHEILLGDYKEIIKDAYEKASDGTDFVYISFDVDSVEATYVPGLNAPVPLGLKPEFVAFALRELRELGAKVLDVTEVAPLYDPTRLTCRVVASIIAHFL